MGAPRGRRCRRRRAPRCSFLTICTPPAANCSAPRPRPSAFIKDGLGPGASAAVYAASEGLTLDFTADADALTAAIDKLRTHQRMSENGLQPCPRITPYQAYLIANNLDYTALNAALAEANQCSNATIGPASLRPPPEAPARMIPPTPPPSPCVQQAETRGSRRVRFRSPRSTPSKRHGPAGAGRRDARAADGFHAAFSPACWTRNATPPSTAPSTPAS